MIARSPMDTHRSGLPYDNDFFSRSYAPWLDEHPEHLAAAAALNDSIRFSEELRSHQSRRHGIDIPETLVISVTSRCNRRCRYCGARALVSGPPVDLSEATMRSALAECRALGTTRIALVGGEPLLHPAIEQIVSQHQDLFFSIYTNGRQLDEGRVCRFATLANCAFIINVSATDNEREEGAIDPHTQGVFSRLKRQGVLFGFSATTYQDNWERFSLTRTYQQLVDLGARFAVLFDYLPDFGVKEDRFSLSPRQRALVVARAKEAAMSLGIAVVCAPEDEHIMGGCSASGRLLLHLSAHGTITPCPFVPFSRFRFGQQSLLEAIKSDYFCELRRLSRKWEGLGEPCAYRAGYDELQSVNARYGATGYEATSVRIRNVDHASNLKPEFIG